MYQKSALRVLLVDPCNDFRYVFCRLLRLMGYTVETASNADEALKEVRLFAPDVVLTELSLGDDVGGLELARRLRVLPFSDDMRLVALSGYVLANTETRALEVGFDWFLAMPLTSERIAEVLQAVAEIKDRKPKARCH